MDPIEKVFKEIELNVFAQAQNAPFRETVRIFRRVRRLVENSTQDFYRLLTSRFMDVNSAPQELGVGWMRLSSRWRNYKTYVLAGLNRAKGRKKRNEKRVLRAGLNSSSMAGSDRFYFGISPYMKRRRKRPHLKDMIAALDIESTLGNPEVTITQYDRSDVYLTQPRPNAVPRVREVGSGRFVNTKTLDLDVEIEAYLTPRLKGRTTREVLSSMASGNGEIAKIMAVLERQRPLFRPYIIWYVDRKAQEIARKMNR